MELQQLAQDYSLAIEATQTTREECSTTLLNALHYWRTRPYDEQVAADLTIAHTKHLQDLQACVEHQRNLGNQLAAARAGASLGGVPEGCTGMYHLTGPDAGRITHDGDTCPVHKGAGTDVSGPDHASGTDAVTAAMVADQPPPVEGHPFVAGILVADTRYPGDPAVRVVRHDAGAVTVRVSRLFEDDDGQVTEKDYTVAQQLLTPATQDQETTRLGLEQRRRLQRGVVN